MDELILELDCLRSKYIHYANISKGNKAFKKKEKENLLIEH